MHAFFGALACLLAGLLPLGFTVALFFPSASTPTAPTGDSHRAVEQAFGITDSDKVDSDSRFRGSVGVEFGDRDRWFGTDLKGGFRGRAWSRIFLINREILRIPISGYPNWGRNRLTFEIKNDRGVWREVARFNGSNPGSRAGTWEVAVGSWPNSDARVVLVDGEDGPQGWFGVGAPLPVGIVNWLRGIPRDYGLYLAATLVVFGFVFVPGLALVARRRETIRLADTVLLAVPGLLSLAVAGAATWLLGRNAGLTVMGILGAGVGYLGCELALRHWKQRLLWDRPAAVAFGVYACAVASALAFGVIPLEVANEAYPESTFQSRMVASPPDSLLPYTTAAYFTRGYDGREKREAYFGEAWSVASRGPLVPLMITALLVEFDVHPREPVCDVLDWWPASADGFYLARILGVMTNALVILGGVWVVWLVAARQWRFALAWLAVCPLMVIDLDYVWPKLFATFFVVLALGAEVERRGIRSVAAWGALAYLAHPIGGLYLVPLLAFVCWHSSRGTPPRRIEALRRTALVAGFTLLFLSPWLLYGHWIGVRNVFLDYPLGGGWGFRRALNFAEWLRTRWDNLRLTIVPLAFTVSDRMQDWGSVHLSSSTRWLVAYAKTLPGSTGYFGFGLVCRSLWVRPSNLPAAFRRILIWGSLGFVLLYWGYSSDGLGRDCLEPLAIFLVVAGAASADRLSRRTQWVFLGGIALEGLSVRVLAIGSAQSFAVDLLTPENLVILGASVAFFLLPIFAMNRSTEKTGASSLSSRERIPPTEP